MHIVVYGPSRSGKSTFTASLYRLIEKTITHRPDLTVEYQTLDLWDNAGPWLLDDTGEVPRRGDPDDISEAKVDYRDQFANLSATINLADAPGEIDDIFRDLISPADELALLISEKKLDQKGQWEDESEELGISLVCHFISYHEDADTETDVSAIQPFFEPDQSKGKVKNLSTDPFKERGLHSLGNGTERAIRHFAEYLVRIA